MSMKISNLSGYKEQHENGKKLHCGDEKRTVYNMIFSTDVLVYI